MVASGTPCESSSTVSRSGHRVASMRRRSSVSSDSGKLIWNSRMAVLPSARLGCGHLRLLDVVSADYRRPRGAWRP